MEVVNMYLQITVCIGHCLKNKQEQQKETEGLHDFEINDNHLAQSVIQTNKHTHLNTHAVMHDLINFFFKQKCALIRVAWAYIESNQFRVKRIYLKVS